VYIENICIPPFSTLKSTSGVFVLNELDYPVSQKKVKGVKLSAQKKKKII
jgi:hypothetical protein